MNGNGLLVGETFPEVVALKHSGDRVLCSEPDHHAGVLLAKPLRVEANDGLLGIQYFKDLFLVGGCVGVDFFLAHRWTGRGFARGVSDSTGKVADQESHFMPELLKLTHFFQQNDVSQVQIRCSGVEARLDLQWSVVLQPAS